MFRSTTTKKTNNKQTHYTTHHQTLTIIKNYDNQQILFQLYILTPKTITNCLTDYLQPKSISNKCITFHKTLLSFKSFYILAITNI